MKKSSSDSNLKLHYQREKSEFGFRLGYTEGKYHSHEGMLWYNVILSIIYADDRSGCLIKAL